MTITEQQFALRLDIDRLNSEKTFERVTTSIFAGSKHFHALSQVGIPVFVPPELQALPVDQLRIKASIFLADNEGKADFIVTEEPITIDKAHKVYLNLVRYEGKEQDRTQTVLNIGAILGSAQNPANKSGGRPTIAQS